MFISGKIPQNTISKIFNIVNLSDPNALNLSEFKVVFKLIYKSYDIKDVPAVLPNSLKYILAHGEARQKAKEIDFMQSTKTNLRDDSQKIPQTQTQQNQQYQQNCKIFLRFILNLFKFS